MSRKGKKPVFLVDNDTEYSEFQAKFSKKAKFHSTAELMGRADAKDPEIFSKCTSKDIHIITRNTPDFEWQQKHHPTSKIGVVGIASTNIEASINTFGEVLRMLPEHNDYRKKYISVTSKKFDVKDRTTSKGKKK